MNADREHRIRGSLERHLPRQPVASETLRRLVAEAREAGVIVFLKSELATLAPVDRAVIEAVAERFAKGSG
jgi:hypothetical protein